MEMRISDYTVTPEKFAAIRAQLRMFFGVPAEVIPSTQSDLRADLNGGFKLRAWLVTHGYEVVRDYSDSLPRHFVIRPETWTNASVVSDKIRDAIDRQVLNSLLGRDVP